MDSPGHLLVEIGSASNVAAKDSNGLSDPYVIAWLEDADGNPIGTQFKTKVRSRTLNPVWGFQKKIWLRKFAAQRLLLTMYDHDVMSADDFMGMCAVTLVGADGVEKLSGTLTLPLQPRGAQQDSVSGELSMLLRWVADEYQYSCPSVVYNGKEVDLQKKVPRWPPSFSPDVTAERILLRMGQHVSTWAMMASEKVPNCKTPISKWSFGSTGDDENPHHGTVTLLVCKRPRHEFILHAYRRLVRK
jgi:C2 domain